MAIDDVEAFVHLFRDAQAPLREERSRAIAIGAKIAVLEQQVSVAVGDDFRKTMAYASAALRPLDGVEHAVNAEVFASLKPDLGSQIFPVWRAMTGT